MKNKSKIPSILVGYGNSMKAKTRHDFFDLDHGFIRIRKRLNPNLDP